MHAHSLTRTIQRWLVALGVLAAAAGLGMPRALAQPAGDLGVPTQRTGNLIPHFSVVRGGTLRLRSESGRDIKEVLVSHPEVLRVEPIDPMQRNIIALTGMRLGTVRVTITTVEEQDQPTIVNVTVLPNAEDLAAQEEERRRAFERIQEAVAQEFPLSNIRLALAGDGTVIMSGWADSAEDVFAMERFLGGYGYGRVINHVRVAGVQQVQLEVCIARVDRQELRRLGFNFLTNNQQNYFGSGIGNIVGALRVTPAGGLGTFASGGGGAGGAGGGFIINPDPGLAGSSLFYGVTSRASAFFGFIDALRQEDLAKVLANPTLVTLSGRPATFLVGGDQPYPVPATLGQAPGIVFRQFGTSLTFLPTVLGDGRIRLEVEPEVSRLNFANGILIAGTQVPQIESQRIHATVEMASGQTFVLGGLLQSEVEGTTFKVPVLGDLPFFGTAFRAVRYQELETEVLILVTPRLVDPLDCSQRYTRLPGQETRTPSDFELFLEGILEAPRGRRPICPDGCYRPAHYWAGKFCETDHSTCCGQGCYGVADGCSSCGKVAPMIAGPVPEHAVPAKETKPATETLPKPQGNVTPPQPVTPAVMNESDVAPAETMPTSAVVEGDKEMPADVPMPARPSILPPSK